MDDVKAKALEKQLIGQFISGCCIQKLCDHGKSAAVFHAVKDGQSYAVKIFDDDLIKKYGDTAQFSRIDRELELRKHPHPHLVKIIDGGICDTTKNHFILMEYLEGKNVKQCLDQINDDDIWAYLEQLVSASRHLEDLGIAHRDIKPENVMIDLETKHLTLMDLGVIRPISGSSLTDFSGVQQFVGTLQYSPPELLLRKEEDSLDGWRAVTFYQIGAVLHDMIMKKPIFYDESEPYPKLSNAAQFTSPIISSDTVDSALVRLAKTCLLKDPQDRLKLLTWDSFRIKPIDDSAKKVVLETLGLRNSQKVEEGKKDDSSGTDRMLLHKITSTLKELIKQIKFSNTAIPQLSCYSPSPNRLEVTFEDTSNTDSFSVSLSISVVDAKSEAVEIDALLKCSLYPVGLEVDFYKGIFNEETLRSDCEDLFYKCLSIILGAFGSE